MRSPSFRAPARRGFPLKAPLLVERDDSLTGEVDDERVRPSVRYPRTRSLLRRKGGGGGD